MILIQNGVYYNYNSILWIKSYNPHGESQLHYKNFKGGISGVVHLYHNALIKKIVTKNIDGKFIGISKNVPNFREDYPQYFI